ncbi:BTAD domain-containing putative transcriptional regulator [Streptomyces sp. NPDC006530]|uniref:AfsR/SARP family transcriptional regulator n=1 Tax=Streptomyces sp. NPDC006530 TaxID=3364750 RepID=UPI00369C9F7F
MEFLVLGPEEVLSGGLPLPISAAKQRALLSMLALRSATVVSTDDLIDGLWGTRPPKTARTTVHNYVRRLRGILRPEAPALAGAELVRTAPGGYILDAPPQDVDVRRFEERVRQATAARSADDLPGASARLREAVGLWRGRAFDGTASPYLAEIEAPRLEEARLFAFESLMDVELQLGRHAEVLAELRQELDRSPLREELRAHYMVALYRSGHRAEALEVYRRGRQAFIEELGLEPSRRLRDVEHAILVDSPELKPPAAPVTLAPPRPQPVSIPRQLPPDIPWFTGREDQLRALEAWAHDPGVTGPMVITAIDGQGGIGKTALALHWAHSARDAFPDGQLYTDLGGYSAGRIATPLEALARFLSALGIPWEDVPHDLERAMGLYRTLLADRRMLIVLDNARNAEQVRPLLPGVPGCFVLVTSRDRLAGLVVRDGARPLRVDALAPAEAWALLERLVGERQVAAEPEATAELAELCGTIPLALRVAAVNALTSDSATPVADCVTRLAAEDRRLSTLSVEDDELSSLQAVFSLSYDSLSPDEQRLFRTLGLLPGPIATAGSAAALLGWDEPRARRTLRRLVAAHLLGRPGPDAYVFHDLLRIYARKCSELYDCPTERAAALARLYAHYLATADLAARLLYPEKMRVAEVEQPDPAAAPLADRGEAQDWLEREHRNLVAAVQQARERGHARTGWRLCDILRGYFWLCRTGADWISVARAGVEAARECGDVTGQAATLMSLGDAHRSLGQYDEAALHYTEMLRTARGATWPEGTAQALNSLGLVDILTGRLKEAVGRYTEALEILPDDRRWAILRVSILGNTGILNHELGALRQAEAYSSQCLVLSRSIGLRGSEGVSIGNRGEARLLLGDLDGALDDLTDALAIHRELGNRGSEAEMLRALGELHRDKGEFETALNLTRAAEVLATGIGENRVLLVRSGGSRPAAGAGPRRGGGL